MSEESQKNNSETGVGMQASLAASSMANTNKLQAYGSSVDIVFDRNDSSANISASRTWESEWSYSLFLDLEGQFNNETIEDGTTHKAEAYLSEAFSSSMKWVTLFALQKKILSQHDSQLATSLLTILGRIDPPGSHDWRVSLVASALLSDDVELRDRAIQASENWHLPGFVDLLLRHCDSEPIDWLQNYASEVATTLPS